MTKYYSKSNKGFYDSEINKIIPVDAVEVTDIKYAELLESQNDNKVIQSDSNGNPISVSIPAPSGNDIIKQKIYNLEIQQTARRVREAAAGIDGGWLKSLNTQITDLRAQIS